MPSESYQRRRNIVQRRDGRPVNVARPRGQLFVCANNCCCGRVEDGFAPVPADLYHEEWERRGLRNIVHLTVGGCLGPCALANVAMLLFDGQALWFHSMNSGALVYHLYDYIEALLDCTEPGAERLPSPPAPLDALQFSGSAWQPRPDGQPVDDVRPHRRAALQAGATDLCAVLRPGAGGVPDDMQADRLIADMHGAAAAPRKNGELVFEAPWQGRAFGMAVALNETQLYPWDDFRERLVAAIAASEARSDGAGYYEQWLAAFEALLAERGVVTPEEIAERTYQFEFGERDDVF